MQTFRAIRTTIEEAFISANNEDELEKIITSKVPNYIIVDITEEVEEVND